MSDDEQETTEEQLAALMDELGQSRASRPNESAPEPAAMGWESPTLASLDPDRRPDPAPVCAACPKSMWFSSGKELKAYCRVMHAVTWDSTDPQPIEQCDGVMLDEG
jgi:hypothetical protein